MRNGVPQSVSVGASGAPGVRLRILVITNRYPRPGHSTIATYNRQQFRALAREHDVRIIAPVPWTDRVRDLVAHKTGPRSYVQDNLAVRHPTYYFSPQACSAILGEK